MHPKVDLVVCEGGPDSLEILPRHIHVQAGDVLEPRSDCFPLRQIQPVTRATPRLIRQAAPGGVPEDPATAHARPHQHGRMPSEPRHVIVDHVNLSQHRIHIRIMLYCPWEITLQVSNRTVGSVSASLTGDSAGVRGEDDEHTTVRANPRPPIISRVDPMVQPVWEPIMRTTVTRGKPRRAHTIHGERLTRQQRQHAGNPG
ncbi:hypothetical protein [Schaalia radingae]|uniref:hypothetical protein n=1 Tax=Schaalia radingae TaxID=131110 RepID=UPI0012FF96DB|nr:hypothetical protein [Schaalia radingae]